MTTATMKAARSGRQTGRGTKEGARLFADLMAVEPAIRRDFVRGLEQRELVQVFAAAQAEGGTPYVLYRDDALGFVEDVLGENVWSKSRQILEALPVKNKIAVPSCFSSSKSWTLSRATLWFSNVHPVGTARVVTLAPLWRQVSGIMWGAEIRGAHARSKLPGQVGEITYKIQNSEGVWQRVAEGIVGNARNEASTQGLHAPHVLVLVDEAGGIPSGVGRNLRALLTAEGTSLVAIGNPPADNEGSWFEGLCADPDVEVIRISALDTPNLTGEPVRRCRTCPPEAPEHLLSKHLVKKSFVEEVRREFGEDSPYYQAKVLARFPRGGALRIVPTQWVEDAVNAPEPEGPQYVTLSSLGLTDERQSHHAVRMGAWVRLGVDVAANGGDEFVIARMIGDLATIEHATSGQVNANAVDVAGRVLQEIKRAQLVRGALGTRAPVRVKIDGIGVGWGVASILKAWGTEGLHDAEIVVVVVSEKTGRDHDDEVMRPANKRSEMWIAMRQLLQPGPDGEAGMLRLRIDTRTMAQLTHPSYTTTSGGLTQVESKESIKKRVQSAVSSSASPDRAEALLLAAYEPLVKEDNDGPRLIM